jgi:3-oxoacyl-[acyl-carrier protein] reductase
MAVLPSPADGATLQMTPAQPLSIESGLAGKVTLVSGGSRGIGRAIVELFARDAADVVFFYRSHAAAAQEVVDAVQGAGGKCQALQVDVCDVGAVTAAVNAIVESRGRIDVLVNNAGIVRDNLLGMLEDDDIRAVLDTNVGGVFNLTRAVVQHMISKRAGRIVNLSSVAGEKGGRGQTNYAASKGAVNAFTKALAVELASRRITVNCVAPGVIETEMSQAVRDLADEQIKARILMRRYGQAQDVAYAVWFLASRFADYITGEVLHVDGGFKME